jgi:hypothetical protein
MVFFSIFFRIFPKFIVKSNSFVTEPEYKEEDVISNQSSAQDAKCELVAGNLTHPKEHSISIVNSAASASEERNDAVDEHDAFSTSLSIQTDMSDQTVKSQPKSSSSKIHTINPGV